MDLPPGTNEARGAKTLGALIHFFFSFLIYLFFKNGLSAVNCVENKLWVQKLPNKVSGFIYT